MKKSYLIFGKKNQITIFKNYKILLGMNGWDTGVSTFTINDWKKFINLIIRKFNIKKKIMFLKLVVVQELFTSILQKEHKLF